MRAEGFPGKGFKAADQGRLGGLTLGLTTRMLTHCAGYQ